MVLDGSFDKKTTSEWMLDYVSGLQEQYLENKDFLYRLTTKPRILKRALQDFEDILEDEVEKAKQYFTENIDKEKTSENRIQELVDEIFKQS